MSKPVTQQELRFSRSTKRTHVFETDADGAAVRSIYVDKSAFDKPEPPARIIITITADASA